MNQDEQHLRLLSIFHYVCAGLAAIFACIPVIHLIMGLMMLFRPDVFDHGKNPPPPFVGLMFVFLGAGFIFLGWAFAALVAWAGHCLSRRRHYTSCLVVAGLACMFMPIGTVLGVFTIIVLVRPSVKELFQQTAPPRFPA